MSFLSFLPISLIIFAAIFLSGIFSAAETALIAISKPRLYTLAKRGSKKARLILYLRQNAEKLIGTILLCNNLANIIAASLATQAFIKIFGDQGIFYATSLMSVLIVIYAEVMPKILAMSYAESFAFALSPLIAFLVKMTTPITFLIEIVARRSLILVGVKIDKNARITSSEEELRGAIDLHQGTEGKEERAMLHSILDLGDVDVGEIMIHRSDVIMINAATPPSQIIEQVIASPYTRIPLWEGNVDNIVGVLNTKALLRAISSYKEAIDHINIVEITHKPWFIPETTSLQEQLQAFRDRKEHFALVVDEYGDFQGIVTLEDILEEIVGEITDEHDIRIPGVWRHKTGELFVRGTTTLRDLNRQFEWNLPDEEASTIAGLILHQARTIPDIGQTFNIQNFRIKIIRRTRNKITLLSITPPKPSDSEQ
jgi:Mg2+/Co2+ transporter CorB